MNRLFYRYQVFGYKGAAAQMMDALIKEKPDLRDGYYSLPKLRDAIEKDKWLYSVISGSYDKDGVILATHIYDMGYVTLGDDEHPGIRPIKWYEPLFFVRLKEKLHKIYWWPCKSGPTLFDYTNNGR